MSSLPRPRRALGSRTLDVDQHVLGRDLSHATQAGQAEEGTSQGSTRPVDGEALLHIEGDVCPVHGDLLRGELPMQRHPCQGVGHLAGEQGWLMAA